MNRLSLTAVGSLLACVPAMVQAADHSMHDMASMSGMTMPAPAKTPASPKAKPKPAAKPAAALDPHAGHDMSALPGMAAPPPAVAGPADPHAGHDMSSMPGMAMPAAPATATAPAAAHDMASMPGMAKPSASAPADAHAGHDMASMPGMAMPAAEAAAPEPAIPHTPPPPAPTDHLADRYYDPAAMAAARRQLAAEHGGAVYSKVMANLLEYQSRKGGGGYRWEGAAWYGGDISRFLAKTEGEGTRRDGLEAAEVQALYSRAIGPYFDLQAGLRQDFKPAGRTYLTVGTEGLAPYWFDVEGAVFLSTKGELLGRVEGTYDLRLTQRLLLQPRIELNLAAQDTRATRTGSGLSTGELGLRLRYEITRQFAPYIGVSFERKFGATADFARADRQDVRSTSFVTGIRTWF